MNHAYVIKPHIKALNDRVRKTSRSMCREGDVPGEDTAVTVHTLPSALTGNPEMLEYDFQG